MRSTIRSIRSSSTCGAPACRSAITASRRPDSDSGHAGNASVCECTSMSPTPSPAARVAARAISRKTLMQPVYPIAQLGCAVPGLRVPFSAPNRTRWTRSRRGRHVPQARSKSRQTTAAKTATTRRATSQPASGNGKDRAPVAAANGSVPDEQLEDLLEALMAAKKGDFSTRMSLRRKGIMREIASNYNDLVEMNAMMVKEFARIRRVIGREGRMQERASVPSASGDWNLKLDAVNDLIDDLVRPTTEIARVMDAVADGDLSQKMALEIGGQPVKGEFLRIGTTGNAMVDQLSSFADEVTRVAREVGTEGRLGGQAEVRGVSGTWKDLTDSVNQMASNLTDQVRNIAQVTTAVANGDLTQKITVDVKGEILELKNTMNTMVDQLSSFADEVTRVAREVGTEGKLGGQARVEGVSGTWRDLTENVNVMASNLTTQVRNIAQVATAVADGDLTQKITVEAKGEVAQLA